MKEVYFTTNGWAYPGLYQQIGTLPGLTGNDRNWTLLGALLVELLRNLEYRVTIYHDTRLVEEWHEDIEFMSPRAQKIAADIKNNWANRFISLEIKKLDNRSLRQEIDRLKLK